jgi:cysteinyl-tRNA synthetase
MFPHHENEIAQSCCAFDTSYVNIWMHAGMVQVDDVKMSKSLGNFFTLRDVLKVHDPETLRFFLMSAHYRSQLSYSQDSISQAKAGLERLYTSLRDVLPNMDVNLSQGGYLARFETAMNDDFNMPIAFSVLFDVAKDLNKATDPNVGKDLAGILKKLGAILGILQMHPADYLQGNITGEAGDEFAMKVGAFIAQRNTARENKDWPSADAARDGLNEMGVVLEDGPTGTTWRKA